MFLPLKPAPLGVPPLVPEPHLALLLRLTPLVRPILMAAALLPPPLAPALLRLPFLPSPWRLPSSPTCVYL